MFNAGKGAVFNHEGKNELDASIMNGKNLMAGAVASIKNIKNPISLAKLVMDKSEHVFLAGSGAMDFAKKWKCRLCLTITFCAGTLRAIFTGKRK